MAQIGPVCHIAPETNTQQPGVIAIPNIPAAQPNLASLAASVNALRQAVMLMAGKSGADGRPGANGAGLKPPQWKEKKRVTEVVKVYNPDDKTQFIEVERINQLVMEDKKNNQTWEYNHGGE